MASIYTKLTPVPVAAVVYAGNKSPLQHILFTTRYNVEGYYRILGLENREGIKSEVIRQNLDKLSKQQTLLQWAIKSLNTKIVRDNSVSQATITVTCSLENESLSIPPFPDLSSIRGGNYPYLTFEDEIRIYIGYVSTPTEQITADMLDEPPPVPFDDEGILLHDPSKPLYPIFWGFIDSIVMSADGRSGIQAIISCRDRARIFQDTKIVSIPNLEGRISPDTTTGSSGIATGRRDRIIAEVARAVTNPVPIATRLDSSAGGCWKDILTPDLKENSGAQLYTAYQDASNRTSFLEEDATEDPSKWMRFATHKTMDYLSRPRFHIWVQRPPLVKNPGEANVFQVINKSPIEIFQYFANSEERPMDFFASQINGDFVFGPRVLDTSGFKDPLRSYRTYFFKDSPENKKPSINQLIISMRTASSSLATFNRFVVVDAKDNGGKLQTLENIKTELEVYPWQLSGEDRKIKPPCRTQIIFDSSLSTYGNAFGAATIVGLASARIWARDLIGIEISVIGDPTFYPSEAVRVYNTIIHDVAVKTDSGLSTSEKIKSEATEGFISKRTNSSLIAKTNDVNEVLLSSTAITDKSKLILPTYKVRNIRHKLITQGPSSGYITDVSMVSDL